MLSQLFFVIFRQFRDHRGIHSVQTSPELSIFESHGFQRSIASAFSDAEQGTVHAAAAIEPCCCRIADCFIKVIVPMPFQLLRRHARMSGQAINNALYGAGIYSAGKVHSIAHGIACPDFNGNLVLVLQAHQLHTERNDKAENIRAGDVFQMAPGTDPVFQAFPYHM